MYCIDKIYKNLNNEILKLFIIIQFKQVDHQFIHYY